MNNTSLKFRIFKENGKESTTSKIVTLDNKNPFWEFQDSIGNDLSDSVIQYLFIQTIPGILRSNYYELTFNYGGNPYHHKISKTLLNNSVQAVIIFEIHLYENKMIISALDHDFLIIIEDHNTGLIIIEDHNTGLIIIEDHNTGRKGYKYNEETEGDATEEESTTTFHYDTKQGQKLFRVNEDNNLFIE